MIDAVCEHLVCDFVVADFSVMVSVSSDHRVEILVTDDPPPVEICVRV